MKNHENKLGGGPVIPSLDIIFRDDVPFAAPGNGGGESRCWPSVSDPERV